MAVGDFPKDDPRHGHPSIHFATRWLPHVQNPALMVHRDLVRELAGALDVEERHILGEIPRTGDWWRVTIPATVMGRAYRRVHELAAKHGKPEAPKILETHYDP